MLGTEIIEFIFGASLFINAMLFIPQIVTLFRKKTSQDVSLVTFMGFCFVQVFTILHGIIHHDVILTFGYILSLLMCGIVTVLIIYYRKK